MFTDIEHAIDAIGRGELVVVVDDADRENEGDLIMAAERVTAERMAFMIRHTSGVICMPVEGARLDELYLPLMVANNTESQRTAFTVSVDARHGTTTGISAPDRATTVKALLDPATRPGDLARPGHIFPLRYRDGGVLKRAGHTEAAVDLARLAGCFPAGVLAEVVNDDGTMARLPALAGLRRRARPADHLDRRPHPLPAPAREARPAGLRGADPHPARRVHRVRLREHPRRDGAHGVRARRSRRCRRRARPRPFRVPHGRRVRVAALRLRRPARRRARGRRRRRGAASSCTSGATRAAASASATRCAPTRCRTQGRDTVEANVELGFPADSREYGIGSQILVDLGITTMRLMTNNPAKYGGLEGYGLEIVERVPLRIEPNDENISYLRAKQDKLGHFLDLDEPQAGI